AGLERSDVLLDVSVTERVRESQIGIVADARSDEQRLSIAYDHRASVVRSRTEQLGGGRGKHREMVLRRLPRTVLRFVADSARGGADECGGWNLLGRAASERQRRTAERQRQERRACYRHAVHHTSTASAEKQLTPEQPAP